MANNTKQYDTSMYKSLCICSPEFEKIPIDRRELGMAGIAISHTLTIVGALADYKMDKFLESQNVSSSIRNFSTLKINVNFGILNFLYKKADGKSNERAGFETGVETSVGLLTGKAMQTRLATKVGISLLTRIATGATTGAAIGSSFPIVGTIIGAVAGTLIAGIINDKIFEEEDKALAESKIENEKIEKQAKQYNLKINAINDYLTQNNYIELRELDDNEAEKLCKEASNLQSNYLNTIKLMLSFRNYLATKDNRESSATSPSPSNPHFLQDSHFPNTINSHRIGEICFSIKALDEYTRMPIKNAKIQLQNVNVGQEVLSDSSGIATFEIVSKEYLKPFRVKLIHKNYQEYHLLDRSIILNAIRSREKPFELHFQ